MNLTAAERKVWDAWNQLPDDDPAPVRHIARVLHMTPAVVASIVYPADKFGLWDDSQEPDIPMTAQDHHREAKRLLAEAGKWAFAEPVRLDMLAEAQLHATLALFPGGQS